MLPMTEEGEAAIIETGAHANAMALGVESNQWHQDEIQPLRCEDLAATSGGFQDAETITLELGTAIDADEPEATGCMLAQHRQIPAATASKPRADRLWVELAGDWQVEGEALCGMQEAAADESLTNGFGVIALLALAQRRTCTTQTAAKQGISHDGLAAERRDTSHLCRCSPSFLNLRVQVGTPHPASGFPLGADMHNGQILSVPGVRIRLKKIPRPLPYTAGDV